MSTDPSQTTLLGLPAELRRHIFIKFFRSVTLRAWYSENDLAILRVCRQIYHEAAPLVLPNAPVRCCRNADVINTLARLGPTRITQLRHLIVYHCPVGFSFPDGEDYLAVTDENDHDSDEDGNADDENPQEDYNSNGDSFVSDYDHSTRYFHLGAVLALFPGLQLDLLEVFWWTERNPYTGLQTTDCFGSLLAADGYRRLWMEASGFDGAWADTSSTRKWKDTIATNFRPHTGWIVRIKLIDDEWTYYFKEGFWNRAEDAGFILVRDDFTGSGPDDQHGYENEDDADIVVGRGDADIVVKPDDGRVLRCIERRDGGGQSPMFFKAASDALKKLFKENNWEDIQKIDPFDDISIDPFCEGDVAYAALAPARARY